MSDRVLRIWICLLLLGQVAPALAESVSDGMEQVPVVSANAPKYPPLAVATLTKGNVLVEVTIDPDGKVVSAKAVEGHPLLRNSAEAAAALWRFQANYSSTITRHARLVFVFDIVFVESVETRDDGVFVQPSRFQLTREIATIAPLPRVAGRLQEERCHLHTEELKLGVVPILYGLPGAEIGYNNVDVVSFVHNVLKKLTHRETYFKAEREKFPNSHNHTYGGCIVGYERKAEVLYCRRCREVEAKWRKKHPNRGPEIVAVISGGKSP